MTTVEVMYTAFLVILAIPALLLVIALCTPDKPEHKERKSH